jgi:hypothetical protein
MTVVKASDLPLIIFKQAPHPFVRISVDRFSDETEVTENPSTSPCWTKTIRLSVVDCSPSDPTQAAVWLSDAGRSTVYPTSVLSFRVIHRRRLFPDRTLCHCELTIEDLLKLQRVAAGEHSSPVKMLSQTHIQRSTWICARSRRNPMLPLQVVSPFMLTSSNLPQPSPTPKQESSIGRSMVHRSLRP